MSNLNICISRHYPRLQKTLSHLSPSIVTRLTHWQHILDRGLMDSTDSINLDSTLLSRATSHRRHSSPPLPSALHSMPCSLTRCCFGLEFRAGSQVTCGTSAILANTTASRITCLNHFGTDLPQRRKRFRAGPGRDPRLDPCPSL